MELYTIAPSSLQFSTRITPDQDETVHRHDYFEIFIVLQGHITHITPFGRVTLQTGDGYLIAPDAPHNFKRLREPCTHRDFMITPTLMKQACDFVEQGLYERLIKTRYLPLQVDRIELLSLENKITKFLNDGDTTRRKNFERSYVVTLLGYIYMQAPQEMFVADAFYSNCLQALNGVFTSPDYFEKLQQQLGYSKVYLCRKFKEVFGQTVSEYVKEKRLDYASYLLLTTADTIPDICARIGIESLPYFNKIFREKYGRTPAKYRKEKNFGEIQP